MAARSTVSGTARYENWKRAWQPTFDVSVQLFIRVQVVQAHQKLSYDDGNIFFRNQAWLQEVRAATT